LGVTRFDTELDTEWPQSVGIGVRRELSPCRLVAVDVIWYDWSSAFDTFDLRFDDATNPAFTALLGPSLSEQFPLNWRDTVSVKVGHEYRPQEDRVWRAGYTYHRNPIPEATLTPFIQGTLEHAFSLGYGWLYDKSWNVDLAYQYSFGSDREVGTSGIIGGDFNGSTSEAEVHWIMLSAMQKF
jgi:long-subunit fatty acid transport protein